VLAALAAVGLAAFALLAPARYVDPAYPRVALLANLEQLPAFPAEARFGDGQFELLGYDLEVSGAPQPRQLTITYYWRALEPSAKDFTVFVHLLGQDGSKAVTRAQLDTYPAYGAYPTSWWRPDRIFVDRLTLPLPAPGKSAEGEVITGLYDRANNSRMRATDRTGRELPHFGVNLARCARVPRRAPGDGAGPTAAPAGAR